VASRAVTGTILIPSTVVGELFYGAEISTKREENLKRIDTFIASLIVLTCDAHTGRKFGEVKGKLRAKGKPIPENDIWIAAVALQHDLTLVTRDKHFDHVDGLRTEVW
jgi:tRNA(fMet)-specific endonuclease VapC